MLKKEILDIFADEKIKYAEAVPFDILTKNPNSKKTFSFEVKSVIVFLIPYFSGLHSGNISLYSMAKDYHFYCKMLEERIIPQIKNMTGDAVLCADTSPVYETEAASLAGLGMIGKHGLLINPEYSSFVFIGGIFTPIPYEELTDKRSFEKSYCTMCGKCLSSCPVSLDKNECISALTQKKGELTDKDNELLKKHGSVWGCDICQLACPYTEKMIKNGTVTEIEFFKNDLIYNITKDYLESVRKEEFMQRAFSWRGKKILERNIGICEKK